MVKASAFGQNILSSDCYFKCNCELCQKEAISNDDDERYEKFEKLRKETKRLHNENNQHVANLPIWEMVDIQSIFPGTTFTNSMINRSILYGEYDPTTQKSQILNSSLWGLPRAYMKGMKHVFLDFGPINGPKRPKWAKTAENPHFWPKNETTIKITFNHQKCTRFGLCS